ncbi:hypothetical protein OG216_47785 (plasmid) [Streptomycetaceae bacterium NBC_01309]
MSESWVLREWRDENGHYASAILPRTDIRTDDELRAAVRRLRAARAACELLADPLSEVMSTNARAFTIERASGLHVPGGSIGLRDVSGGRLRAVDAEVGRLTDQLIERSIARAVERGCPDDDSATVTLFPTAGQPAALYEEHRDDPRA